MGGRLMQRAALSLYDRADGLVGRVVADRVAAIYKEPRFHSGVVRWTRQDELLNLYYAVTPPDGPAYNPVWYRVWGGFIHSGYLQLVEFRYQQPLDAVPSAGQLGEITVPYTQAFQYSREAGWLPGYRLYYETTHWITDVVDGPDGKPWYQLTSELTDYLVYYVRAEHLRPIPDEEIAPISPELPYEAKRIVVSLKDQMLTAYEADTPVFWARISSGLSGAEVPKGTQTPRGRFHITSKSPSKHMGNVAASGAPDEYILPGVPWTSFFIFESGVAFHGTFWHNNFGIPQSHGCINMRNADAKWLFRWVTPVFPLPVTER
ncbi:MAG: murein L,D-transpeptidase, partial [Anaerolineae bacterium]